MSAREIWLIVKQNNNYEVSNFGKVRNIKTKRILKPAISNKGYYLLSLSNNCKSHTYTVHKLVMETFNIKPIGCEVINHIDHNKLNNNIDNLEYCTQKDNTLDAWNNGLCENVREKAKKNIKKAINSEKIKVNQYNKNNELIKKWNYIREAGKELNINNANIVSCCKGNKYKSVGGYIWKYANAYKIEKER